jgi:hypothetical protein
MQARLKPCQLTNWRPGRWREVSHVRVTNRDTDCHGGGVPMNCRVIIYADKPCRWYESTHDFAFNCEKRG